MTKEEKREYIRKYRQDHKEIINEQAKIYREKNKEKLCKRSRTYYNNNKKEISRKNKIYRKINKEKISKAEKCARKLHPEYRLKSNLLSRTKIRAKEKKISNNLTREWFDKKLEVGVCTMTGISFIYEANSPYTPSIDRIDSDKGYTQDNCQIVCKMYNLAKNIWSDEDVKLMAEAIVNKTT